MRLSTNISKSCYTANINGIVKVGAYLKNQINKTHQHIGNQAIAF